MGDFAFLEYSYNSKYDTQLEVFDRLCQLGFSLRSKHNRNSVTFWSQQTAILMVRDNPDVTHGKITGIGLVTTNEAIAGNHDSVPCTTTDFFKIDFPVMGFNLYLLHEHTLSQLTKLTYTAVNENRYKVKGHAISSFSGVEFDSDNERLKCMLESFGFSNDSEDRTRFVSPNKGFTALFRDKGGNQAVSIIAESKDIFKTTASLAVAGVEFLKINPVLKGFKELEHKIVGYDCAVFGTVNSHSIEKYIMATPQFATDFVIRQRRQFMKLEHTTFDYYDSIKPEQLGYTVTQ